MIAQICSYTLRHRAIVIVLLLLFIFAGINAFERLPVEAFPDVSNMSVQVNIVGVRTVLEHKSHLG